MSLSTLVCTNPDCELEFVVNDTDINEVEELTCPVCGEDVEATQQGEEEPTSSQARSNPRPPRNLRRR